MSEERLAFRLPDVGEGLEDAEVVRWLVAEGDEVGRDQPLVEVLTDKAQVELPSPVAGRVVRLAAASGDRVKVGGVLVELVPRSEPAAAGAMPASTSAEAAEPAAVDAAESTANRSIVDRPVESTANRSIVDRPAESTANRRAGPRRPKASPSTRRLAATLGVDLTTVRGTGPGARIIADDVRAATPTATPGPVTAPAPPPPTAATAQAAPAPATAGGLGQAPFGVMPLRGIRRLTAQAMARSWSEIPHITGMDEVDASALLEARHRLHAVEAAPGDETSHVSPLAFLALAVVQALRRYPLVNATLDVEAATITVHEAVHLGIAVATDAGLVVPVVHHADRLGVAGLGATIARLAAAGRNGRLAPADLRGGTFTITNYGSLGGRFATPIIRPGEAGIVGFGAIRPRPCVVGERVEPRPMLPVVFSADHRLVDGDLATAFQEDLLASIREPLRLLLGA